MMAKAGALARHSNPLGFPLGVTPYICDATFREGQQAGHSFTVAQITQLFSLLHHLGGARQLIRSSEFFCYTPKDRRAVEACQALGFPAPRVTAWARAHHADLRLVRDMEIAEVSLLMSVSPQHLQHKFGWTQADAKEHYLAILEKALAYGLTPRCHFEDVTRADIRGFCIPLARDIMAKAREGGRSIIIRLCDTLGVAMPYERAPLPLGVYAMVQAFVEEAGVPGDWLEFHGHNDFHRAHANTMAAWQAGCAGASASLMGLGERTGTASVEGAAMEFSQLAGDGHGLNLQIVGELAKVLPAVGVAIPSRFPLLGERAFAHVAGLHLDGLRKAPETYEAFDPREVLGREPRIVLTDKSGRAGVAAWVEYQGAIVPCPKDAPLVTALYDIITTAFEHGRTAPFTDAELVALTTLLQSKTRHTHFSRQAASFFLQIQWRMPLIDAYCAHASKSNLGECNGIFYGLHQLRCTDKHGTPQVERDWGDSSKVGSTCHAAARDAVAALLPGPPGAVVPCLPGGCHNRLGWAYVHLLGDGARLETVWDLMQIWPKELPCPATSLDSPAPPASIAAKPGAGFP